MDTSSPKHRSISGSGASSNKSPDKKRLSWRGKSGEFSPPNVPAPTTVSGASHAGHGSLSNSASSSGEIINLNVGGRTFSTTRHTLLSIPDTFFTSLLSGRIPPAAKDPNGYLFIDRDPDLFNIILNFLRTRQIPDMEKIPFEGLKHEAEFYGISPLLKRLNLCSRLLMEGDCGDVMFQGIFKGHSGPVLQMVAHHNIIAVATSHTITAYRLKDSLGWQKVFESEKMSRPITCIALCYLCNTNFMHLSCIQGKEIRLLKVQILNLQPNQLNVFTEIGKFKLQSNEINALFFAGSRLVALAFDQGRVGIWHQGSPSWLEQPIGQQGAQVVISSFDKADSKQNNFLLLGTKHGSLFQIDMQKFPIRMKDADLLINELYEDPDKEEITSISIYLSRPESARALTSIEIVYGTKGGVVRILVQHPETGSNGPQLFQTFKVHLEPVLSVMLNEKFLISVCKKMHVRTWKLTRFRGLISTQPGSTPHASFKLLALPSEDLDGDFSPDQESPPFRSWREPKVIRLNPNCGPFGDQEDGEKQVLIEKLRATTSSIRVVMAANGHRIGHLKSVDGSNMTCHLVHECEAVAMGSRSRRYILTGHQNGKVQAWDLTTGFERMTIGSSSTSSLNGLGGDQTVSRSQLMRDLM